MASQFASITEEQIVWISKAVYATCGRKMVEYPPLFISTSVDKDGKRRFEPTNLAHISPGF